MIPDDTDILITHGPPYGILDRTSFYHEGEDPHVGCKELLDAVTEKLKLRLHLFGHVHPGHGVYSNNIWPTKFVNAAICDEKYRPIQKPIVVELP